ncbi:MAG: glycosyl hydrolase [Gammaproteobacteria bacterium]|nr:glycosyl hydrolase [Gammaproteobacteria bacterium]
MYFKSKCSIFVSALLLLLVLTGQVIAKTGEHDNAATLKGLEWRMIGPYRGGRVTTVAGVVGKPMLYYMGSTGGGVWKTENAGTTWENISDAHFKVGTIGAVAVSESDNNVLYVGTGEAPIRGVTTSSGDGVWKSTDAGKTWKHIGLENSGQIGRIEIHPTNSDIAWVAVQGQIWTPSVERGVFRTTDGGKSWEHVLKIDAETGATDLSLDPTNPRILYAAMWSHGRKPWFIKSGGTDGGIYKSIDGGDNWKKLTGGLPEMIGKIGVDVSASNPDRVYAIIEAEPQKGGLWRSDDAGETWALINGHRVLHSRAWYYIHITADPVNEDTVYVMNVPMMKSVDGGKNWEKMTTPHGDHHDHWVNPDNNMNMINANDGGATVTFDGGETWSTIMNQPTAQFYRVTTDNLRPFRIYAGQQDNTTVGIASESLYGGIGVEDYFAVGGGESAHIAFDPDDPTLIYATTINGTLTEYDHSTRLTRYIIPFPEMVYGKDSRDLKYRTNWNAPVAVSPHDPSIIYYGTQMVLRSTNRGASWTEFSGDLTRNDPEKQGRNGGPLTPENVGAEFYNTLFYIVESPHEKGLVWVGSDDGLVHIIRDDSDKWENVSPKHPGEAMINAIEISPHDKATVYLAVTAYKLGDNKPYIYKTTDYGKSWKRIDKGLPQGAFVRVVREDPTQKGLLYAGTELGMFVSYDDGGNWQSLDLNLPPVPITDLALRQDKLVASTQGRGIWVLDDLFVVRQADSGLSGRDLHVFTPGAADLSHSAGKAKQFEASNPDHGVPIYYYLDADVEGPFTIDILDVDKNIVRSYSSEESDFDRCKISNMDPRMPFKLEYPAVKKGLNKWTWDMKRQGLKCTENITLFAGFDGPGVPPGKYTARVSAGDSIRTVSFQLNMDPRVSATDEEIRFWSDRLAEVGNLLSNGLVSLENVRQAQQQIEALMAAYPADSYLQTTGKAAVEKITAWDGMIIQVLHQTYEDEDAWETMLAGQLRFLLDVIDDTGAPVTGGAMLRLQDLKAEWGELQAELQTIRTGYIDVINEWAKQQGVPHVGSGE